jgi:uncharacterized membrane protein required for colicin V production
MGADIAVCVIVFVSAVCYAHIGFARTVISALQWVLCLVCGFLFSDDIKDFLYKIGIGTRMEKSIAEAIAKKADESLVSLPGLFREWAGNTADYAAKETAQNITGFILMVLAFLAIILSIKLVLFLITHLLSKKYNDGPLAFIDSAGGMILGVILGVFYVLVILAVLVLVLHWLPQNTQDVIMDYLNRSYFTGIIYDNNPLLTLLHL